MRPPARTVMGFMVAVLLTPAARSAGPEGPPGGAKPVLEVASPDPGDCSLGLTWPWGSMAVKRVLFDDHEGPFKAVVESTGQGVRVTFDGWAEEPFFASADKRVRVVYRVGPRKELDFTAEAISADEVRVLKEGKQATRGKRIVIKLGEVASRASATGAAK